MKSQVEKIIIFTLDEYEATWLKNVMQNPLHEQDLNDEREEDRAMRRVIFDFIKDALKS